MMNIVPVLFFMAVGIMITILVELVTRNWLERQRRSVLTMMIFALLVGAVIAVVVR